MSPFSTWRSAPTLAPHRGILRRGADGWIAGLGGCWRPGEHARAEIDARLLPRRAPARRCRPSVTGSARRRPEGAVFDEHPDLRRGSRAASPCARAARRRQRPAPSFPDRWSRTSPTDARTSTWRSSSTPCPEEALRGLRRALDLAARVARRGQPRGRLPRRRHRGADRLQRPRDARARARPGARRPRSGHAAAQACRGAGSRPRRWGADRLQALQRRIADFPEPLGRARWRRTFLTVSRRGARSAVAAPRCVAGGHELRVQAGYRLIGRSPGSTRCTSRPSSSSACGLRRQDAALPDVAAASSAR